MATAFTPLANITLGSSAASVTFSSISSAYRDLFLVSTLGLTSAGQSIFMQFNNDTAANYAWVTARGNGTTAGAQQGASASNIAVGAWGINATTPIANINISVMDYSATDKHKSSLSRDNDAALVAEMVAGRWANTAAVTTLKIYPGAGNFVTGSTFALYGVSA